MNIRVAAACLVPCLSELVRHLTCELGCRGVSGESVRGRKEIAFERCGCRVEIADQARIARNFEKVFPPDEAEFADGVRNVEHVGAFWYPQLVVIHFSAR